MGVQEFASGKKGVTRAIQECKVRKQRKVKEKTVLLRKYHKVMKQEGYDAAASRKQQHSTTKPNPFSKSLRQAQDRKQEQQEVQRERETKEREKQEKLQKRKQRAKLLSRRTRKGQPVMKHVIHNMLDKIQQDHEE